MSYPLPVLRADFAGRSHIDDHITIHNTINATFNVLRYGTVGDGIADDTAAMQAAVDAAQVAGGIVFLPIGTYLISSPILIRNSGMPIIIRGSGYDYCTIKLASGVNDYAIKFTAVNSTSLSGYMFEDFAVNGNYSGQSAGGCIYALGAVECHFNRLHLHHAYHNALYLHQDGNGGMGHHNRITNCLYIAVNH